MPLHEHAAIQSVLDAAVEKARRNRAGAPANYIPELAAVDLEATSAAVVLTDGLTCTAGDAAHHRFTLQSSAKLISLIGLLEERGPVDVFGIVGSEPSGESFASVARLETHGPMPANPLINAGAIALCGQLAGTVEQRVDWIRTWAERLCGGPVAIDEKVRASERHSADCNRAIAYFLKHGGVLRDEVEPTLDVYFALCSLSAGVREASLLSALLATGGLRPGDERAGHLEAHGGDRGFHHGNLRHVQRVGKLPGRHRHARQEWSEWGHRGGLPGSPASRSRAPG